jgi:ribosomal RNA-processing protein 12
MEVDPEDEIVRAGKVAKRKQTGSVRRQVAPASKAEEAELPASRASLSRRGDPHRGKTTFGANFGDAYHSRKGGKGDVMRPGSLQPHAYLPLNPRMLGRKNKRQAAETAARLVASGGRRNSKAGKGLKGRR